MPRPPTPAALPVLLATLALAAAACAPADPVPGRSPGTLPGAAASGGAASPSGPSVIPVIISRLDVGHARFVFSFLDADGNLPAASPDRTAQVAFIAPGGTEPGTAVDAEFVWAIEGARGEYVAYADFPVAGAWKAVFVTSSPTTPPEAIGVSFDVVDDLPTVEVGDRAPASDTPTSADVGGELARISTDTVPDPRFYEVSVADALAGGRPFVLVFATPAFCQSSQCGPTLERIKAAAGTAPADIAFINVEPYRMTYTEGRLQPVLDANNQVQANAFVDEWGILTEPWIFAVDGAGIVRGSFEGIVTDRELDEAFEAIAGT